MSKISKLVLWFDEIGKEDVAVVGGKSASLGELTSKTKVPVPYGFATTSAAYRFFIQESGLEEKITDLLSKIDDVEDSRKLREISADIRQAIVEAEMPRELQEAISEAYNQLAKRIGEPAPFVAVRSSATAEDLPDASFAGQQDTYLNVQYADEVIDKVKECYASTFTDRAIYYRSKKDFGHLEVALSAVIQLMVFSKAAGVMFTVDVVTGSDENILIEGAWGLGEYIVQGTVTPDSFLVRKNDLVIENQEVHEKNIMLVRKAFGGCEEQSVPESMAKQAVLTEEQVKNLARYAIDIEKHYGSYMDIEWGIDERNDKLWILQARPETVWSRRSKKVNETELTVLQTDRKVLVKGLPASPGRVAGKAHVILDPKDIDTFHEGEILVTEMTAPDWVPVMKKASAIVTDAGGMTCHASIVSRELGIPCIVGTKSKGSAGTLHIKNGVNITVDASNGTVYEGILSDLAGAGTKSRQNVSPVQSYEYIPVTGTKIYMNLGDPSLAEKYAQLPCDGIGLMREEFIWTTYIHEHPLYLIETERQDVVISSLSEGIVKVVQSMGNRPVTLRFSDFKSSEYRELKGGSQYEPYEHSSLLGWRGASRYYDPNYIEAFKLELKAVRKVREEYGFKNLNVMIPFCRTVEEAAKVTALMAAEGLNRGPDFKVWLMAEIPANIILADKFNQYVDGYSIGSNDLTMLVLGCDRDNDTVSHVFDERNLAVKRAIKHLIEVAHKDGKTVSICGQAPSVYPDFIEFLIKSGIDSISVNPDAVKAAKKMAAQIEQRLLLDKMTGRGIVEQEDYTW